MHRRVRSLFAWLVLIAAASPLMAAAAQTPLLRVTSPFVLLGTSANFTLSGDPLATYVVYRALQPAEVPLGVMGTLFMKSGTFAPFASGTLDASGNAAIQLAVANVPSQNGVVTYVQASVTSAGAIRLSNAVPFRAQSLAPSGGRSPRAIAVTPDGTKAYVAHQLDGAVSVIDLVTGAKIRELPVGPSAARMPFRPLDIAIDPDGRHAFVVNVASSTVAVIDVASDSIAGQVASIKGSRRIAFDFTAGNRRIYLTNEAANALLVLNETTPGTFTPSPSIPLQGAGPGPLARLADGRLVVGHRASLDLELVNPLAQPGSTTLARIPLNTQPLDIAVNGTEALVPVFKPSATPGMNGTNLLWRVNLDTRQITNFLYPNAATDYNAAVASGARLGVIGSGSGTVLVGDLPSGALEDTVNLLPGLPDPNATPQALAFGPPAGAPAQLYVVDQFRETVRAIALSGSAPLAVGPEIALSHSGIPRVPLSGALSALEDGDYLMRSVHFFNGTATTPNSVSCQTCHTDGYSDNITRLSGRQPQGLANLAATAPFGWQGSASDILAFIRGAFNSHGKIGGPIMGDADLKMQQFFLGFTPPTSIYLQAGGALSSAAQAGKILFETGGTCTGCHAAPEFLPPAGQPRTIVAGVGTGLVPINVPSLRGVWLNAPYFHDGSAKRLGDVFTVKPGDIHNQLTGSFTAAQRSQLVAYLQSL